MAHKTAGAFYQGKSSLATLKSHLKIAQISQDGEVWTDRNGRSFSVRRLDNRTHHSGVQAGEIKVIRKADPVKLANAMAEHEQIMGKINPSLSRSKAAEGERYR